MTKRSVLVATATGVLTLVLSTAAMVSATEPPATSSVPGTFTGTTVYPTTTTPKATTTTVPATTTTSTPAVKVTPQYTG